MVRKVRSLFFVVGVVVAFVLNAGIAAAQATVWDTAKELVPANAVAVIRLNVAAMRRSSLFSRFVPALLATDHDLMGALDDIQRLCKVDVVDKLEDVVIAVQNDDTAAVFFKIQGVNERKVTSCLSAVAKSKHEVVAAKRTGAIVEYSAKGSHEKIYVGWPTADVAVVASKPNDRRLLASMLRRTNSGFAASNAAALARVDTSGIAWGVASYVTEVLNGTMRGGHAAIGVAAGVVSIRAHIRLSSAQEATSSAAEANKYLAQAMKQLPPALTSITKGIEIGSYGDELTIAASAPENDVGTVIQFLLGSM